MFSRGRVLYTSARTARLIPVPANHRVPLLCFVALAAFGIVASLVAVIGLIESLIWPGLDAGLVGRGFANYWMAGRLLLEGQTGVLYSPSDYLEEMQVIFGPGYSILNWGYPPHLLIVVWPFGFLSYKTGLVVWLGASLGLYLLAIERFRAHHASDSSRLLLVLAVAPFALMMINTTQNGFLTAGLTLLALTYGKDRTWISGIALGLLTIKPLLALFIAMILLVDRDFRSLTRAAATTLALIGLSVALTGIDLWAAYLTTTIAYQIEILTEWYGVFLRMMPTTFGAMRTLGFSAGTAFVVQCLSAIIALATLAWILRHETDALRRTFAVLCATFLISPYGFNFDMGALAIVAIILVGSRRIREPITLAAVAFVAAVPAAVMNLGRSGLPIAPVLLMAALAAIALEARRDKASVPKPGSRSRFE